MAFSWIYLVVFILSVVLALLTTPTVRHFALAFGCVDAPSERKVHQQPVVRLGGVAIFVATLLPIFVLWGWGQLWPFSQASLETIGLILVGGSGFFLVGFADDLFDLSAGVRLGLQCAIAAGLWWFGLRVETLTFLGLDFPALGWLSLPVTVLWLAGVVNAMNWMDGLDGLATGVAGIVTAVLFLLAGQVGQPEVALLGVALLGSLVGFLYYNYSPASIFMGDGGSYFVGFMLASLCVVGPLRLSESAGPVTVLLPLVILAVPLGDMLRVILARLVHRQSPFAADNRHLHHRLLRVGLSHKGAVWVAYGLTLVTGSLAFVLLNLISWRFFVFELLGMGCLAGLMLLASFVVAWSDAVGGEEIWFSGN